MPIAAFFNTAKSIPNDIVKEILWLHKRMGHPSRADMATAILNNNSGRAFHPISWSIASSIVYNAQPAVSPREIDSQLGKEPASITHFPPPNYLSTTRA
jgi:hypothetical protein